MSLKDEIKDAMIDDNNEPDRAEGTLLVPSGSVMLNLACSDTAEGAWKVGRLVNIIGDSSSGKSLMAMSMLAEICTRPEFDEYRLIYDDAEHALDFDVGKLFGYDLADRLEPPAKDKDGNAIYSDTTHSFQANVMKAFDEGKPFIYVLDSFDALTSVDELDLVNRENKALEQGKSLPGSYGAEKAKHASRILRVIVSKLEQTKSFILIISQTRDDINPTTFAQKTRAGGKALKFYASHEIWLAVKEKLKKTVANQDYQIGVGIKAKITKNKLTGKLREVEFPIYYSYGIDDLEAGLNWLLKIGAIEKKKQTLSLSLGDETLEGTKATIINRLNEDDNLYFAFLDLLEQKWKEIEEKLEIKRPPKFRRRK